MKKNILIAVTVIASLCLLYWGIEFLKGVNMFKPANFYYADFDKVDGLNEAAPVTIKGFPVGQVREITYDYKTNKIKVMLALNKDLRLPHGSSAHIESSITGTSSLAIILGNGSEYYKVGEEIDGVVANGLMDKVNSEVMPGVVGILPKVDSIMGNVNALVANPALQHSVYRLDAITVQLTKSSQQLTQLLTNLNSQIPGLMKNVGVITNNLNGATDNLNVMSGTMKSLPIDSTVTQLNATIANLNELSQKLNNKDSNLGMLLNDKSLYNNADKALADLDSLLIDIKKHPKRYINIKVF